MTNLRVNGIPHRPVLGSRADVLTTDRLRTIIQDSHLNFLIGAGTPSAFFGLLGNIEEALTDLVDADASEEAKAIVRASIQATSSRRSWPRTSRSSAAPPKPRQF
jgi:hypothetical protein